MLLHTSLTFCGKCPKYKYMKLLLTSAGLTNKMILQALFELVGKKADDTSVVFVPTAANIETGDKTWVINDLIDLKNQNFKFLEIVDISALPKTEWLPKFTATDVIYFEGGDAFYLMDWIYKSGLVNELAVLLEKKVLVGVSAGSIVTNKILSLKIMQDIYGENSDRNADIDGLNFVDFYVLPHYNSLHFEKVRKEFVIEATKGMREKIYVLDDNCAVKVDGGSVDIVGEGQYLELN